MQQATGGPPPYAVLGDMCDYCGEERQGWWNILSSFSHTGWTPLIKGTEVTEPLHRTCCATASLSWEKVLIPSPWRYRPIFCYQSFQRNNPKQLFFFKLQGKNGENNPSVKVNIPFAHGAEFLSLLQARHASVALLPTFLPERRRFHPSNFHLNGWNLILQNNKHRQQQ